jgi:hypothetical protein
MPRKVPRKFSLHFGSGVVAEEATYSGQFHEPTIQLLEFQGGDMDGQVLLRFCTYTHKGSFMRDPLLLNDDDIAALREAIAATPRIKALLQRLVE